jgi:hypothetical protein
MGGKISNLEVPRFSSTRACGHHKISSACVFHFNHALNAVSPVEVVRGIINVIEMGLEPATNPDYRVVFLCKIEVDRTIHHMVSNLAPCAVGVCKCARASLL